MDILTEFEPASDKRDYFIHFQSNVKGENDFYHDANGYLVIRRVHNVRPDYEFDTTEADRINANTYPATSFAYIKNADKKMVVGVDRAEGVTLYADNPLLANIDRLTFEDGKGASETYSVQTKSTFRHRVALVGAKDDVERLWQKEYDEPIVGYHGDVEVAEERTLASARD